MKKLLLLASAAWIISTSAASAQANLTFSGGNGSAFSMTLAQSIVFTITAPGAGGIAPSIFVFDGVGNVFAGLGLGLSINTNITFTINSDTPRLLEFTDSGINGGDVTADDLNLYRRTSPPVLNVGDIVTLNAGTFTTNFNVPGAPPANGLYNAFITTGNNRLRVSTFAAPIPEPGSLGFVLIGGVGLIAFSRTRAPRRQV